MAARQRASIRQEADNVFRGGGRPGGEWDARAADFGVEDGFWKVLRFAVRILLSRIRPVWLGARTGCSRLIAIRGPDFLMQVV